MSILPQFSAGHHHDGWTKHDDGTYPSGDSRDVHRYCIKCKFLHQATRPFIRFVGVKLGQDFRRLDRSLGYTLPEKEWFVAPEIRQIGHYPNPRLWFCGLSGTGIRAVEACHLFST